jgi:rare lipoprotein A (peptidoglycan hydrolase)
MYIVRLQRAVFQEWKVKEPWANPGDVTIANSGDVAKEAALFPANALRPIAPDAGTWPAPTNGYSISGVATWYGPGFVGKAMANGATYNPNDPTTTASNAYPLGSKLKVTSMATGKSIEVIVRDTGGFAYPDVADLSPAAFTLLGRSLSSGVVAVVVVLESPPPPPTSNTQAPPRR